LAISKKIGRKLKYIMSKFHKFEQQINEYSLEFLFIGESKMGVYDHFDLDDVPLMRIFISKINADGTLTEYKTCQTQIRADSNFQELRKVFDFLIQQLTPHLDNDDQMTKLIDFFSWLRWRDGAAFVAVGDNS